MTRAYNAFLASKAIDDPCTGMADLRQAFDAIGALLGRIDRLKAGLAA